MLLDRRAIFCKAPRTWSWILAATAATIFCGLFLKPPLGSLLLAAAFGLALFTFIGVHVAYKVGVPNLIMVVMRDVLYAEMPLILRREIYATALSPVQPYSCCSRVPGPATSSTHSSP